ncbi:MAG: putative selenate reductase subunit YgfK [Oscillospiraceae bacterium]
MSDRMTPIPFGKMMDWVLCEYAKSKTVFGVSKLYKADANAPKLSLFGENIELPFGPAAGPHTQLAQNIIAAYSAGSRFFELKTVQTLDGEDLPVAKPCINAADECYNVEWSTELWVPDAYNEYVKAWFALKLISRELSLGAEDGFIFNMSVGYDLEGIRSAKIDAFIEGLKNAETSDIWQECKAWAMDNLSRFKHVDKAFVEGISPMVCRSATLSTLHGCPPDEIERIASYLLREKGVNTFIKCNPTLLGYSAARKTLDALGYDYIVFDEHHFNEDLQFADAVPMLKRLQALADAKDLSFGVKLTNTFPVDIAAKELPGNEMYMSGRSLFALSLQVAQKLTAAFDGKLRMSFSGGADIHNIADLYATGIWPITLATTLLKPGGYNRLAQIAEALAEKGACEFVGVNGNAVDTLLAGVYKDSYYKKPIKPLPVRKSGGAVPLVDCFTAPCRGGCPIKQDIPAYLGLVDEGRYQDALNVILERNPLPFITGTICAHPCMSKCSRAFYDDSVNIRAAKLKAAETAFDTVLPTLAPMAKTGKRVAVIGGGPAGMAAAFFLARDGASVTIFEKRASLGGIVRHVIPSFRIADCAIDNDVAILNKMGVKIELNSEVKSLNDVQGFDAVMLCTGAWLNGGFKLEGANAIDAVEFLESCKAKNFALDLGENVVIIGGGNTAMDASRAAKRVSGVKNVRLVYRRDKRNMPADEEELQLAIDDGVEFCELLSPVKQNGAALVCEKMRLGDRDASGRRSPEATGEYVEIAANTVVAAVGEKVDSALYAAFNLQLTEKRMASVNGESMQAVLSNNIYVLGDARRGPATVVEAIADAAAAAKHIMHSSFDKYAMLNISQNPKAAFEKKGVLETGKCLECATVCENCTDVCPNRANVAIAVQGSKMPQILHVDGMCNECGNCETFCPYESRPYKDKFTLYWTEQDFANSENSGFAVLDGNEMLCLVRLNGNVGKYRVSDANCGLPADICAMIISAWENYPHLFCK